MLPRVNITEPTAIAFSGGGDSTAMIHAFADHPHVTHAFIIDHALRAGSAAECAAAADFAASLGYQTQIDRWAHDGVTSAVQVKARAYRYGALGRMCNAAGVKQLMTAHTADDQAETLLMRLDRKTGWRGLAGMAEAAYAPLWPVLAGVTLLRPWLDVSRAALRDYNAQHGLSFVDDPSNENTDFTRIRARQALSVDQNLRADLLAQQMSARARLTQERIEMASWMAAHAVISPQGYITLDAVPSPETLLHVMRAASGTGGPIDQARRRDLVTAMSASNFKAATLAGAWVVRAYDKFVITRDMVAVRGRGMGETAAIPTLTPLMRGEKILWDGRVWVEAFVDDMTIRPAFGNLQTLREHAETKAIFDHPEAVRPTLPVYYKGDRPIGFGALSTESLCARATAARRLQALFRTDV